MSGSVLVDYDSVTTLIADITAQLAAVQAGHAPLVATLTTSITNLTILRDLKFPAAGSATGLVLIDVGGQGGGGYSADIGFTGGVAGGVTSSFVTRSSPDAPTTAILQTFREDWQSYSFTVPAGRVDLELGFADTKSSAAAQRVMDISVNGALYIQAFDPYAVSGGPGRSVMKNVVLNHAGGLMTVTASASAGSTLLNSLRVTDATGVTVSTPITATPTVPTNQWLVEYFANPELTGSPIVSEVVASGSLPVLAMNFDGITGPKPGLPATNFSIRARGKFTFTAADYTFYVANLDDGARLFDDSTKFLESWIQQAPTPYQSTRTMTAAVHEIELNYKNTQFSGSFNLTCQLAAAPPPPPPPPPGGTVLLGSFQGSAFSSLQAIPQWDQLVGRATTMVHTFMDSHDVGGIQNCIDYVAAHPGLNFKLSLNVLIGEPGNFGSAAERARCQTIAQMIQNAGIASRVHIRHMYEFNANYGFEWQPASHGDFTGAKQLYTDIVNQMRAIAPGLKFIINMVPWNDYAGHTAPEMDLVYCTAADYIGHDVYNSDASGSQATRWVTVGERINNGVAYALAKGKQWCLDEFANRATFDAQGGGDDETYTANMWALARTDGHCVSATWYQSPAGGVDLVLGPQEPNSLAATRTQLALFV